MVEVAAKEEKKKGTKAAWVGEEADDSCKAHIHTYIITKHKQKQHKEREKQTFVCCPSSLPLFSLHSN